MIQRIQSLWFFLIAVCVFLTYSLILYTGKFADGTSKNFLLAENFLLAIGIIIIGLIAIICLFLFKNRNLQFKLAILGVIFSIIYVILEYLKVEEFKKQNNFSSGTYMPQAFLPFIIIILFILAARGIYRDEKLVKSLDRLR